jgi:hypothetical protein
MSLIENWPTLPNGHNIFLAQETAENFDGTEVEITGDGPIKPLARM